jgi:hypothetical protein
MVSPWIHLPSRLPRQATTILLQYRYDQRRCIENGQEGIIAIDIQDGYDKFNDNVKILSTALKT